MPDIDSFLSSEGRLGRVPYTIRIIILGAIATGISLYTIEHFSHHEPLGPMGYFLGIVATLICSLIGLMQMLKRLRDAGKGAYLTILMLFPVVNLFFLLYTLVIPSRAD